MKPARCIEHDDVVSAKPRRLYGSARDLLRRLPLNDRKRIDASLLAKDLQLLLRRRTPRVERRHQHFLLFALIEALRNFRRRCGFA